MPDPEGLSGLTGAQYGLLGTILVALGAGANKVWGTVSDSIKNKDDRLSKLEADRFQLILDEWRADRLAAAEQHRLNASVIKENTSVTVALGDAIRELSQKLNPVHDSLKESSLVILELKRRLADKDGSSSQS